MQTLEDVCKIDVLKDFAKFKVNYLYQILYLLKLQAPAYNFIGIFKNPFLKTLPGNYF